MSKLTTKKRNALPNSSFAGADRSYPVFDKKHAANAKARATQMVKKGKLSESSKAKIDSKANKVLGKKKGNSMGKNPPKNPLKNALNVKRGQNVPRSKLSKSVKAPVKVSVDKKISQKVTKIRKS